MTAAGSQRMRIALWRPVACFQSVFQKTPGRRSTHGTVLAFTKRLTGGVVTERVSLSAGWGDAGLAERATDRVAELLDGERALELPAVDEERGRGAHPRRAPLALVGHDVFLEPGRVQALGEPRHVEAKPPRVPHELVAGEGGLRHEEQ